MSSSNITKRLRCLHCGQINRFRSIQAGTILICSSCRKPLIRYRRGAEIQHPTCTYCTAPIEENEVTVACPSCFSEYHEECWKDGNGCQTYGCPSHGMVQPETETDGSAATQTACARCHRTISDNEPLILCPGCGHPYHMDCWNNGHCVTPGCSHNPYTGSSTANRPQASYTTTTSTYTSWQSSQASQTPYSDYRQAKQAQKEILHKINVGCGTIAIIVFMLFVIIGMFCD